MKGRVETTLRDGNARDDTRLNMNAIYDHVHRVLHVVSFPFGQLVLSVTVAHFLVGTHCLAPTLHHGGDSSHARDAIPG